MFINVNTIKCCACETLNLVQSSISMSYYNSSPRSVSSVLSIEFRQVGRLRRVAMSGCQRCLECGCLAVSDVLCADVWLSAMSCVRMTGCQRCLVCGCLAVLYLYDKGKRCVRA